MSLPQPSSEALLLLKYGLGGWNLALNGDLLLQGVLIAQAATYIGHGYHRTDPCLLRLWVAVLTLSTLGKTIYALVFTQTQMQGLAAMFQSTKTFDDYLGYFRVSELLGVVLVYYVQVFFCWRTWTLSKRLWIPLGLGFIFTTACVTGMVSILDGRGTSVPWSAAYLTLLFVGDGLLSGATICLLLATAKNVSRDTASILERLSKLTIHSAVPGAVCTLVNLIASQTSPSWNGEGGPQDAAAAATVISNHLLSKFYALSAMWILNSRKSLRKEIDRKRDGSAIGPQALNIDVSMTDSLELGDVEDGSRRNSAVEFAVPGKANATYAVPMKDEDDRAEEEREQQQAEEEEEEEEEEHSRRRYRSKRVTLEQALRARLEMENKL